MRVYVSGNHMLVAACDAELLGRTLREGEVRLHVSSFYDGPLVTELEFAAKLREATIGNFVGERAVAAAARAGFVDPDAVLVIEGVPHAQMVVV